MSEMGKYNACIAAGWQSSIQLLGITLVLFGKVGRKDAEQYARFASEE